ncbi:hypothetical protein BGZ58_003893, partial [Dissophora ornata]
QDITRFGTKSNTVIHVNGSQAEEKTFTAEIRREARQKAIVRCEASVDELQRRIESDLKVRKQHFTAAWAGLASSFYWSQSMRDAFVEYMHQQGWNIVRCDTEADVAIARDCGTDDIVVSGDSDMLAYHSVSTLWRPVANNVVLVYKPSDICRVLGVFRVQLTALAVVSGNDYGKNIYSLGPATNFSIIKQIEEQDVRQTVHAYLEDSKVVAKNTDNKSFEYALRVFVDLQQTPARDSHPSSSITTYDALYTRLKGLCVMYRENKNARASPQSSTHKDQIIRLRSSQSSNRYKTVESPSVINPCPGSRLPRMPSPQLSPSQSPLLVHIMHDNRPITSPSEEFHGGQAELSHPALQRTRIPRHQPRYSFKTRKGCQEHPRPPKMKQLVKLMPLDALKSHVRKLDAPTFDANNYDTKGYVSRGSIVTDGFRIYLLAFKLREL